MRIHLHKVAETVVMNCIHFTVFGATLSRIMVPDIPQAILDPQGVLEAVVGDAPEVTPDSTVLVALAAEVNCIKLSSPTPLLTPS